MSWSKNGNRRMETRFWIASLIFLTTQCYDQQTHVIQSVSAEVAI